MESKAKEKVADTKNKQEVQKMLPRKSTRAAQISLSLEKPISEENEVIDAPTQDKPVREKEEPTKKNKI